MSTVRVSGVEELHRKLKGLPDKVQRRVMQAAMRAGLKPLVKRARSEAPVGTGNLKKMIRGSVKRLPRQKAIRGRVAVKPSKKQRDKGMAADYARHVIRGTRRHTIPKRGFGVLISGKWYSVVEHPGAKPDPFMDSAYQSESQASITAYRRKFIEKFELEASKP